MIGRVILAALLAGIAAGLFYGAIQHVRLTPLILEAEKYENAGDGHSHDHGAAATNTTTEQAPLAAAESAGEGEAWAPADGAERTLYTFLSSIVAAAGFAAVLAGVSLLTGLRITRHNGILWGLAGFLAVNVATAASLPPELPGMPAGDLLVRQVWWVGAIAATGIAIWLFTQRTEIWAKVAAVVLVALPHIIGVPMPPTHESAVPAVISAAFAANTIAAAALMWLAIGGFLGVAMDRFVKEA
ncbi:CbtA family protein [Taklimakanibacter lacteus]|uniref:CbtA family protein n=1 Tax=Taklimakanibacter lacteus TaxID=2268456 RepID=UPI000E663E11